MAYRKSKPSKIVTDTVKRYSGMTEIDTQKGSMVEYGDAVANPCNSTVVGATLQSYTEKQNDLNEVLARADGLGNDLKEIETAIQSLYKRVLTGAVSKFGEDSNEVEMLGGTRKSERKHRGKKPTPPTA